MDETKRHRGLRILIPAAVTALFARAIAVFLHVGPRLDIALQLIFFVACLMIIACFRTRKSLPTVSRHVALGSIVHVDSPLLLNDVSVTIRCPVSFRTLTK